MFERFKNRKANKEIAQLKSQLIVEIDNNINGSQKSIDEISKLLIDFKKHKYSKHDSFLNLCIFSEVVDIDLTILLEKIRIVKRIHERKLYARVLAVVIVDYIESINVLIGRDCLKELKSNKMFEFIDVFKSMNKKYSTFRKLNDKLLREIRNNTLAHKSKDALKLIEHIKTIDVEKIYQFGLELKIYSKEFVDLSTKIIYYISDYMRENKKL
jgi:hypothetical protein